MSKKRKGAQSPPQRHSEGPPQPTIHQALRASDRSGAVYRQAEITREEAVERRRQMRDVVVCGPDKRANRALACEIEAAVGTWPRHDAHKEEGPYALPHYQQQDEQHPGHTFYETDNDRARSDE
jgi:hypothetical protein